MKINAIKTDIIRLQEITIQDFLDKYVPNVSERSVIAISSKVISIMLGRVSDDIPHKEVIAESEADYVAKSRNKYNSKIVIKYNAFLSCAGIDESNGDGNLVLLPKDPQTVAKSIYESLKQKHKTKEFGVVITDSSSSPLRLGAMGVAIGFCGFSPLNSYIGRKDIFGRELKCERSNQLDAIAAAANLVMGEGDEQTPIAVITDLQMVKFNEAWPTEAELTEFNVSIEDDYFGQLLTNIF